ncbi:hypothetical protein ACFFRR_001814 [Megaselia abdita]
MENLPVKGATIDEALAKCGFGKYNILLTLHAGFTLFNTVLEAIGISYVLPIVECNFKLSSFQSGLLSAVSFIGIISSSHLMGFLSDTMGRRKIMAPCLLMGFAVTIVSSFAPTFEILFLLRFVNGFLLSSSSATIYAYLGEFHSNAIRNRVIMAGGILCSTFSILFPLIAWVVINQEWSFYIPILNIVYKPWRLFILVCGLPGFFSALCLLKFPESPKFTLSVGEEAYTLKSLRTIYAWNTGNDPAQYEIKSLILDEDERKDCAGSSYSKLKIFRSMWNQTAPLFSKEHRRKTFFVCILQFSIYLLSQGVFLWFPYILNIVENYRNEHPGEQKKICDIIQHQYNNLPKSNESLFESEDSGPCKELLESGTYVHNISLEFITAVFFMLMGLIVSKLGRIPTFFLTLTLCGICQAVCIYIDEPMIAIYLFVVALIVGVATNIIQAITVDIFPTQLRGMAVCICLMMGRLGCVTGANLFAALIETHCEVAFLIPAGLIIAAGLLSFLIPKPKFQLKPTSSDET